MKKIDRAYRATAKRVCAALLCLLAAGCSIGISNNPLPPDKCYPAGRAC